MKWLARLARQFGFARGVALALLIALAALRVADPLPIQELRVRVFDLFQVLHPRDATERPVVIIDVDEEGPEGEEGQTRCEEAGRFGDIGEGAATSGV